MRIRYQISSLDDVMHLTEEQASRIIEMAWEDRTPFEAIERLYGLPEKEVIKLMRSNLKQKTLRVWA